MLRVVGRQLLRVIPVLFLVSLATFFMIELVPGDPAAAVLGPDATIEQYDRVRSEMGLDEPIVDRYADWLGGVVRGDLGRSLVPPVQDVSDMILSKLPVTLQLAGMAVLLSLLMAVPAAMIAANQVNGRFDRWSNNAAFAAISVPSFLAALILIYLFVMEPQYARLLVCPVLAAAGIGAAQVGIRNRHEYSSGAERRRYLTIRLGIAAAVAGVALLLWFAWPELPRQGFSRVSDQAGLSANLRHAFLPALALALTEAAVFMRLLRSDLITTLQEDFVLSAKAKGLPSWYILLRHALRPSSFSLITVAGVALGRLIGGTVIVESIFRLPGLGTMLIDAIKKSDFAVVQGGVLVIAVFYVLVNSVVDLAYAYLDPRIRRS